MDQMREAWTDERLDDLAQRMDRGFEGVGGDIRELRQEIGSMRSEFGSLRSEFGSLRTEMSDQTALIRGDLNQDVRSLREDMHAEGLAVRTELNARLDALQRTMIQFGGAMVVSFVGLIVTLILRGG